MHCQRRCPSGLPTPLRYFIFTLYFSLFLSYIFGLKGLLLWSELSVSLFLFIWRLKWLKWDSFSLSLFLYLILSLSLWSLNHNWLSFTLVFITLLIFAPILTLFVGVGELLSLSFSVLWLWIYLIDFCDWRPWGLSVEWGMDGGMRSGWDIWIGGSKGKQRQLA